MKDIENYNPTHKPAEGKEGCPMCYASERGVCVPSHNCNPAPQPKDWEERFDEEFGFLFPPVTVSARQAGDVERAEKINLLYRDLPRQIKAWVVQELARERKEAREACAQELAERIRGFVDAHYDDCLDIGSCDVPEILALLPKPETKEYET